MKSVIKSAPLLALLLTVACGLPVRAQASTSSEPYKVLEVKRVGGAGGFDYVFADAAGRRLYIPRGDRVDVYDLESLQPVGKIADTHNVHGTTVDPKSHHGFSSSKPVMMWDTQTLAPIKSIEVEGGPDGILFDPATQHVLILSHRDPNVTVIDSKDGSIVGTIALGGAPEQAATDGEGHIYIDIEDKDVVAVVDAKTLAVTNRYELGGEGKTPAGLALDAKNHVLFVCCRNPATCVVLNADNGKILATLPIGNGTDGAGFNPNTLEAFSSQRDGTLTMIKEESPTHFAVEQTVQTKVGARTSTLDLQTNRIFLITGDFAPAPTQPPMADGTNAPAATKGRSERGRPSMIPDSFSIVVVGH